MKKIKIALIFVLAFAMLLLCACGGGGGTTDNGTHTQCVDANGDGKCDECNKDMTPDIPDDPCTECKDNNGDGKCDACGNDMPADEPCTECKDENGDGKCDACGEDVEPPVPEGDIVLVENKTAKFQIVVPDGISGANIRNVDNLIKTFKGFGITVQKVEDKEATAQDIEILIGGNISSRGSKYQFNMYDYGEEGYAIKIIGNKIVVIGGSDEGLATALEVLQEDVFGITDDTRKLTDLVVARDAGIEEIQDNYKVKNILLNGTDIRDFTIAVDKKITSAHKAAKDVQALLYSKTGYWLPIVTPEEADKSIVITLADKTGGEGYSATFTDGKMEFVCEYTTSIQTEILAFFNKLIVLGKGTVEIKSTDSYTKNVRDVLYSAYGAVGDGETDDSEAIRKAHEYANEGGHIVLADYNAVYYIGAMEKAIQIKTNVDWRDARFILDDYSIKPSDSARSVQIFNIPAPDTLKVEGISDWIKDVNANGGIDASTITRIPLNFQSPALLRIYDSNHKNYIRYGVNENDGASQVEVILVDKDGNIDPTTPFMFDYEQITSISVYPVDVEPITIQGGTFVTYPFYTSTPQAYTSYARGINCSRSNVTFKNITHILENEGTYDYNSHTGDYGCPYGGFYSTNVCNNVLYENCITSAHVVYKGSNGAGMGTYDVSPGSSINITYKNCYQEENNFFNLKADGSTDMSRWGVMGSSYCKNITFDNSKLTRFDAHNGVHNVYLIDSELKMLRIDGTGTFYMENCVMYNNTFVGFREDYGGFWDGNIILKNNTIVTSNSTINLFTNTWYNHYFGYPAAFPTNIIVDGLTVYKDRYQTPSNATINFFGSGMPNIANKSVLDYIDTNEYYKDGTRVFVANKNKLPSPERIIIRNCEDVNLVMPEKSSYPWLANTIISINEVTECNAHFDIDKDLLCDDCGAEFTPCTEHSDLNKDGRCTWCGVDVEIPCPAHRDIDRNNECDICHKDYTCSGHKDANLDHKCDECKAPMCNGEHFDTNNNCECDVCYEKLPCVDKNSDKKCDVCKKDIVATN